MISQFNHQHASPLDFLTIYLAFQIFIFQSLQIKTPFHEFLLLIIFFHFWLFCFHFPFDFRSSGRFRRYPERKGRREEEENAKAETTKTNPDEQAQETLVRPLVTSPSLSLSRVPEEAATQSDMPESQGLSHSSQRCSKDTMNSICKGILTIPRICKYSLEIIVRTHWYCGQLFSEKIQFGNWVWFSTNHW